MTASRLLRLAVLILAGAMCGGVDLARAQDQGPLTTQLPLFRAMTGKIQEQGVLIPGPNAAPLQGKAEAFGQFVLGGLWFQLDGMASYGPVKWQYRWMFRADQQGDQIVVYGLYIDTMKQQIQYLGPWKEEEQQLSMKANLPDGGTALSQLTLQEGGTLLIQNMNLDPSENPAVRYQAEARQVPAQP